MELMERVNNLFEGAPPDNDKFVNVNNALLGSCWNPRSWCSGRRAIPRNSMRLRLTSRGNCSMRSWVRWMLTRTRALRRSTRKQFRKAYSVSGWTTRACGKECGLATKVERGNEIAQRGVADSPHSSPAPLKTYASKDVRQHKAIGDEDGGVDTPKT